MNLIDDVYAIFSLRRRVLDLLTDLTASISTTFNEVPAAICLQLGHSPQGLPSTGCSQFTALARIFATVVLPVPRVPQNRYACPILPEPI